jgi:hypothetical protein
VCCTVPLYVLLLVSPQTAYAGSLLLEAISPRRALAVLRGAGGMGQLGLGGQLLDILTFCRGVGVSRCSIEWMMDGKHTVVSFRMRFITATILNGVLNVQGAFTSVSGLRLYKLFKLSR